MTSDSVHSNSVNNKRQQASIGGRYCKTVIDWRVAYLRMNQWANWCTLLVVRHQIRGELRTIPGAATLDLLLCCSRWDLYPIRKEVPNSVRSFSPECLECFMFDYVLYIYTIFSVSRSLTAKPCFPVLFSISQSYRDACDHLRRAMLRRWSADLSGACSKYLFSLRA